MGIGWTEILLIALVALLLFGAGRLPELGRSLGEGIRGFKRGLTAEDESRKALPDVQTRPSDGASGNSPPKS